MIRNFILKHEKGVLRALEILPGFVSWNIILFPYWGIFVIPEIVAYSILAFNIYWFYQSLTIALTSTVSHLRIQASMNFDWLGDLKTFPDWGSVHHAIIITTYKEPLHILQRTLKSIAEQTLPTKQITVVLATEKAENSDDREEKVSALKKEFGARFANFFVTVHELSEREVRGKASNERHAAVWLKKELIDRKKMDIDYITVTSCDADHKYHPQHFAALTYKFLDNPTKSALNAIEGFIIYLKKQDDILWKRLAIFTMSNYLKKFLVANVVPTKVANEP